MTFRSAASLLPLLATPAVAQIVSPVLSQTAIVSIPGPQFGTDAGAGAVTTSRANNGYAASVTGVGTRNAGGALWSANLDTSAPNTGNSGTLAEFRGELTFTAASPFTLSFTGSMLNYQQSPTFGDGTLRVRIYRSGTEIFAVDAYDPNVPLVVIPTSYTAGDYRFYYSATARSRGFQFGDPQFTRFSASGNLTLTPVPEPASIAVLGLGLAAFRRRPNRGERNG